MLGFTMEECLPTHVEHSLEEVLKEKIYLCAREVEDVGWLQGQKAVSCMQIKEVLDKGMKRNLVLNDEDNKIRFKKI